MSNPFLRRATEYFRDDTAFLSIVTPVPLISFFRKPNDQGMLLDLPVLVTGSPGSGKTTIATLLEFRLMEQVLKDPDNRTNRDLAQALNECNFARDGKPVIVAVRLPMESGYRDFWELPYDNSVKTRLVLSLIQARAILAIFRNLTATGQRKPSEIKFIMKRDAEAAIEEIGGTDSEQIRGRARDMERAIYSVGASLVPPPLEKIDSIGQSPYRPFDVIQEIEVDWGENDPIRLRPLVILDDAHVLQGEQMELIFRELARREIKVSRWMMMRLDTLNPKFIFRTDVDPLPGLKMGRDYEEVAMQMRNRDAERVTFRKMAIDMANRYLPHHRMLNDKGITRFGDLLPEEPIGLSGGQTVELRRLVESDQHKLSITASRRKLIDESVDEYAEASRSTDIREDMKLAMVRILMHRYANRTPQRSLDIFGDDGPDPIVPLKPNSGVADGARAHLHALFGRARHFGIEDLCDASDENAELFLQMAGNLVSRMETLMIRRKSPVLQPQIQQEELSRKASDIVDRWTFPLSGKATLLVEALARECAEETLKPNAKLGGGANAIGILQNEMSAILESGKEIASVLKYAVAYGALKQPIIDYHQGGKLWCLLELSGPICLKYSLTMKRGGFLERRVDHLIRIIEQREVAL